MEYARKKVPDAVRREIGSDACQQPVARDNAESIVLRPGVGYIACPRFEGDQGDILAETVQTRLAQSAAVRLVERMRLGDAMKELKLQDTGLVDSASTQKLGGLVGAKYVLVGSSKKGSDGKFHINCRLVVAKTGQAVPGVAAHCLADPSDLDTPVMYMATELLKRMCGPILPVDTEIPEPTPSEPARIVNPLATIETPRPPAPRSESSVERPVPKSASKPPQSKSTNAKNEIRRVRSASGHHGSGVERRPVGPGVGARRRCNDH